MANVPCSRIVSTAASSTMTTAFLTAIRATGTTRNASGFVVDSGGAVRACWVNTAGNWDLTTSLSIGVAIDVTTFNDLRGTWPSGVALVLVTLANGVRQGILVTAGPSDPPPPPPPR